MFRSAIAVGRRAQQTDPDAPSLLPQIGLNAARIDDAQTSGLTVVMAPARWPPQRFASVARGLDYVVCARASGAAAALATWPEQVVSLDDLHVVLDRAEVVVRQPVPARHSSRLQTPSWRWPAVADVHSSSSISRCHTTSTQPPDRVPGLRLLDLEDLVSGSSVVELRRRTEIIDEEFERFGARLVGQHAGHMIAALHRGVYAQCREALATSLGDAGLGSEAIDAASRSVAGKLLHAPTMAIKALMAAGDESAAAAILSSHGISTWQLSGPADNTTDDTVVAARGHAPRTVKLVARSGHRRHEVGRVRRRTSEGSRIAS